MTQKYKSTFTEHPGNDLGAFMSGPKMVIHGNAQDASGNTMNEGQIIIHGHAGDLTGHSMRGGKIFVKDYVGYRVGIHMKEYKHKIPQIVIGETAGDFLAEYMAGGVIVILGLNLKEGEKCKARFVGTGMHGGVIYERGEILEPASWNQNPASGQTRHASHRRLSQRILQQLRRRLPKQSSPANSKRYCHSQSDPTKNYTPTKLFL